MLKKRTDVYYLNLSINSEDYHIYVPKNYYDPIHLMNNSVTYVEYEPNQFNKDLIDNIIKIK